MSGGKWRDASREAWLTASVCEPLAQPCCTSEQGNLVALSVGVWEFNTKLQVTSLPELQGEAAWPHLFFLKPRGKELLSHLMFVFTDSTSAKLCFPGGKWFCFYCSCHKTTKKNRVLSSHALKLWHMPIGNLHIWDCADEFMCLIWSCTPYLRFVICLRDAFIYVAFFCN